MAAGYLEGTCKVYVRKKYPCRYWNYFYAEKPNIKSGGQNLSVALIFQLGGSPIENNMVIIFLGYVYFKWPLGRSHM